MDLAAPPFNWMFCWAPHAAAGSRDEALKKREEV
jgi:hypothetical protein